MHRGTLWVYWVACRVLWTLGLRGRVVLMPWVLGSGYGVALKASRVWPLKVWEIAPRSRLCGGKNYTARCCPRLTADCSFLPSCCVFSQHHMASEMLLTEGLDNSLCAYNALISGCTSSRGYDRALGYYKDMVSLVLEYGIQLVQHTYTAVVGRFLNCKAISR